VTGGGFSILGYRLCFFAGLIIILSGVHKGEVLLPAVLLIIVFLLHTSLRITLTSEKSVLSFWISRYGLLMITLIGATCGLLVQRIHSYTKLSKRPNIIRLLRFFALLIPLPLTTMCIGYLVDPPVLAFYGYQSVTDNTIILFCLAMILLEVLWGCRKPFYVVAIFTSMLTFCTAVISVIGSTSIVAFWGLAMVIFLWQSFANVSKTRIFLSLCFLVLSAAYLVNTPLFELITLTSRLAPLMEGSLDITSITSRVSILLTFFEQFNVQPVLGNFRADEMIGLSEGNYIHSIMLSLLTHTGVIGFLLVSAVILIIGYAYSRELNEVDVLSLKLALGICALGTLYAFFTWPPFWFFLGFLSIRPGSYRVGVL